VSGVEGPGQAGMSSPGDASRARRAAHTSLMPGESPAKEMESAGDLQWGYPRRPGGSLATPPTSTSSTSLGVPFFWTFAADSTRRGETFTAAASSRD
jgi:hypothetical protein